MSPTLKENSFLAQPHVTRFVLLDRRSVDGLCYSCTMAARGLRGVREWRRYIDHEGGARVGL